MEFTTTEKSSECSAVFFLFALLYVSILVLLSVLRLVLFLLQDLEQEGAQLGLSILHRTTRSRNTSRKAAGWGRGQCGSREAFQTDFLCRRHLLKCRALRRVCCAHRTRGRGCRRAPGGTPRLGASSTSACSPCSS